MKEFFEQFPHQDAHLILIGSIRGNDDLLIANRVEDEIKANNLTNRVHLLPNLKYEELLSCLRYASVGLHTMEDEHFGIGIVEMIAAGLRVVAHNSAGPKLDIVKDKIGFLATSPSEYANKISLALSSSGLISVEEAKEIVNSKFSDEIFYNKFSKEIFSLLN